MEPLKETKATGVSSIALLEEVRQPRSLHMLFVSLDERTFLDYLIERIFSFHDHHAFCFDQIPQSRTLLSVRAPIRSIGGATQVVHRRAEFHP